MAHAYTEPNAGGTDYTRESVEWTRIVISWLLPRCGVPWLTKPLLTNTFSKGLNHQSFGILWSKAVLSQQARPFQLQTELVGNGYYLSTTSVGIQLITDIKAMIFRDTSRITELEEDLRRTAADNAAMRARLEGDLNDLIEKLKKAEDDIERLKQRRVSFVRICLSTY